MGCTHTKLDVDVDVEDVKDVMTGMGSTTKKRMMHVRARCHNCQKPFSFAGIDTEVRFDRPFISEQGEKVHLPIESDEDTIPGSSS